MTTEKILLSEVGELTPEEQKKLITDNTKSVSESSTSGERRQLNGWSSRALVYPKDKGLQG